MLTSPFEVGKAYTFSIYPSSLFEDVFDHVVCTGVFTYQAALTFMPNLESTHALVRPYLPPGTPKEAYLYTYVQFQLRDGTTTILGVPWINIDTVKVSEAQKILVEIRGVTATQLSDVRTALEANGYKDISLNVVPDIKPNDNKHIKAILTQP